MLNSPPAHAMHNLSPASMGEGATGASVAASVGADFFGPGVITGEARVRHGITEDVDLGGSVTVTTLPEGPSYTDATPIIFAGRALSHIELVPGILSFEVGMGGGASAAGGYFAPDLGLTLGYENQAIVPYVHANALVSAPLTSRNVAITDDGDLGLYKPHTSVGGLFGTGARIPTGPRAQTTGSLFLEFSILILDGPGDPRVISMFGAAYEHRFERRRSADAVASTARF